jgi:hypothetical protein
LESPKAAWLLLRLLRLLLLILLHTCV